MKEFNFDFRPNERVTKKLIEVYQELVFINVISNVANNKDLLKDIFETIEVVGSNAVEDIHTTVVEASSYEHILSSSSESIEYLNNKKAFNTALQTLDLSGILRQKDFESINSTLIGSNKGIRKIQVTIKNSRNEVVHTPPPANELEHYLSKLLNEFNKDTSEITDRLTHALLFHSFFEWTHPFYDGNGRVGRLLLSVMLYKQKLVHFPTTMISHVISKNKKEYYDSLVAADNGDLNTYLEIQLDFLLESLKLCTSISNKINEALSILHKLHNNNKELRIINALFSKITSSNKQLSESLDMNNKTISKYIDKYKQEGWVEEIRKGKYVIYKNVIIEKILNDLNIS